MEKGGIAGLTEKKGGKAGSEKPIGDPQLGLKNDTNITHTHDAYSNT